jgi:hypothetical protein
MKSKLLTILLLICICTVARGAQNFSGTYTTSIGEGDVPPELKNAVGIWEISLGDQNDFTASKGGEVQVRGNYSIAGDQITFADAEGAMACAKDQATGSYHAALDGDSLTFTKTSDACKARSIVLTSHSLTRKKNH